MTTYRYLAFWCLLIGCQGSQSQSGASSGSFFGDRTRAFVAGVLEFQSAEFTSFSTDGRQDAELVDELKRQGVPAENITSLYDRDATRAQLQDALARALEDSRSGETFVFYFTGHGFAGGGSVYFVNYDADNADLSQSAWDAGDVVRVFIKKFRGQRLILLGDFCNSGILSEVAAKIEAARPDIEAWAFASAHRWSYSTGTWTFTETILAALRGASHVDTNSDGKISMAEVASLVGATMHVKEKQMSSSYLSGRGDAPYFQTVQQQTTSTLGAARQPAMALKSLFPVASVASVDWDGVLEPAKVVEVQDEYRLIEYRRPIQDWREWIHVSKLVGQSAKAP